MVKYVLDTHALIWFLEGNPKLGTKAKAVLSNVENQLILPIIALAEALFIVEKGRIRIPAVTNLWQAVHAAPHVTIYPLTTQII